MTRTTIDCGIHLGWEYARIAVLEGPQAKVIRNRQGLERTPCAVWIDRRGKLIVGQPAQEGLGLDPGNVFSDFPHELGRALDFRFERSGRVMRPEQLTAEVLKSLRADVRQRSGEEVRAAVIAVRAGASPQQSEAVTRAAQLAGLLQSSLLQEPVAAALAYGLGAESSGTTWMVYDLEGGRFAAAVVQVRDGQVHVVVHREEGHLGSRLVDWAVVEELLIPAVRREHPLAELRRGDPKWQPAVAKLRLGAEEARSLVAQGRPGTIRIPFLCLDDRGQPVAFEYDLQPEDLDRLAEPLILRSVGTCRNMLFDSRIWPGDIGKVLLVGEGTLHPSLRPVVSDRRLGLGIPCEYSLDPATVVVRGAAIFAGTQPLAEAARHPVRREQCAIQLEAELRGPGADLVVRGAVTSPGRRDFSGFTLEFANTAVTPTWFSGKVGLLPNGTFATSLWVKRGQPNVFQIELCDGNGTRHDTVPDRFTYAAAAAAAEAAAHAPAPAAPQVVEPAPGAVEGAFAAPEPTAEPAVYQVELDFRSVAPEVEPMVGGRVVAPAGQDLSGFTIEFIHAEISPAWRSGKLGLAPDGGFTTTLRAEKGRTNVFLIELCDASGTRRPTAADRFPYTPAVVATHLLLTDSIGVALPDNQVERFLARGTPLPATARRILTTGPLAGTGDGYLLRLPLVEGESPRADRNRRIGWLEVRSDQVRRSIPLGSEVEVTIVVDESRLVRARAYVPMLDEEFEVLLQLGAREPDPEKLRREIEEEKERLARLQQQVQDSGDPQARQALERIDRERMVHDVESQLDAAGVDPDAADRCEKRLLDLRVALDEVEDCLEWPSLVAEAKRVMAEGNRIVNEQGDDNDRRDFQEAVVQATAALDRHDPDLLRQRVEALRTLTQRARDRVAAEPAEAAEEAKPAREMAVAELAQPALAAVVEEVRPAPEAPVQGADEPAPALPAGELMPGHEPIVLEVSEPAAGAAVEEEAPASELPQPEAAEPVAAVTLAEAPPAEPPLQDEGEPPAGVRVEQVVPALGLWGQETTEPGAAVAEESLPGAELPAQEAVETARAGHEGLAGLALQSPEASEPATAALTAPEALAGPEPQVPEVREPATVPAGVEQSLPSPAPPAPEVGEPALAAIEAPPPGPELPQEEIPDLAASAMVLEEPSPVPEAPAQEVAEADPARVAALAAALEPLLGQAAAAKTRLAEVRQKAHALGSAGAQRALARIEDDRLVEALDAALNRARTGSAPGGECESCLSELQRAISEVEKTLRIAEENKAFLDGIRSLYG